MSGLVINAGSGSIAEAGQGWTNSYEQAKKRADEWLQRMASDGFTDLAMTSEGIEREGRWTFFFTHQVTGVTVSLVTHGIDDLQAYEKQQLFSPRVYWDGSSSAEPQLCDFSDVGFAPVMTFRAVA